MTNQDSESIGRIKNKSNKELNKVLRFIDLHCSDFLKDMKKSQKFLYRGISNYSINAPAENIFLASTPTNRKPLGLTQIERNMVDIILKKHNFKSLRSNSISCTSNFNKALKFGNIYFIFPLNGFSFHWSNNILDIGSNVFLKNILWNQYLTTEEKFQKIEFKNDNFLEALIKGNEISIHGNYIAVFRNNLNCKTINKYYGLTGY